MRYPPCQACSGVTSLVAFGVVYPELLPRGPHQEADPLAQNAVLVCWKCQRLKHRGAAWQGIDWRRHEKQWRVITRKHKQEDLDD